MAQRCPNRSRDNPDGSAFCITCGNALIPVASSSSTFLPPPPPQSTSLAGGRAPSLVSQVLQAPGSRSSTALAEEILPMGTVSAGFNEGQTIITHAFAGHGVPIMHHSWLLEGNASSANEMFSIVMDILRQRNVQGLRLSTKKLREGGFQIEERWYLIARRGVTTVFTYIAPAGRDLYISRATSVLLSISPIRVTVLALLLSIALFAPPIFGGIASSSSPYSGASFILSGIASLVAVPIWIYLAWYLILSFIYWIRERDFWIYLRSRTLNNFQMDDIMHLEHATDETVLAAAKQLGLDASKIIPPAQGYRPERHVRVL